MVRFSATFDGKVLIPEQPIDLPRGVPLDLTVEAKTHGAPPRDSVLDLVGLGREMWCGIDAVEYQRGEREGWD